ncbi:unnamed protein product [Prunus armeniaca]
MVALFNNHRSQVSLYLWGGSKVYKKRFVANLHRFVTEAYFHKWRATYASTIPDDMHVKLVEPSTDDVPRVNPNYPDARIITFRPFYFSLGFTFPLPKFFKKVRCYEMYAQVRICNAKLFDNFSQRDHMWHAEVLEVSGRWEGKVGNGPLVPLIYYDEKDNNKKLDLEPDMAKVHTALNILKEVGGLAPAKDIERWKQYCPDLDDYPTEQEKSSTKLPEKRKATPWSSKDEAATSRARDVSLLRKKLRLPSVVIKSAEKAQVGVAHRSFFRVKLELLAPG